MNRVINSARKYAATAPAGRFAAGAVLLLAAAGTVGATQGMTPFAAQHPTAAVAGAATDDPWTVGPRTDDPWTSAPHTDDPWTSAPKNATATTDGARTDDPWT
ncbi:hypothetical protein [Streptomyces sp. NPDC059009]|uniref:hypothetical protein n=1 Tax=Streptomyces sp. NPDC059009 TaxID=3346694 RepID=UPI0036A401A5